MPNPASARRADIARWAAIAATLGLLVAVLTALQPPPDFAPTWQAMSLVGAFLTAGTCYLIFTRIQDGRLDLRHPQAAVIGAVTAAFVAALAADRPWAATIAVSAAAVWAAAMHLYVERARDVQEDDQ
jgi:hypothetical protein